ncbi:Putative DNA-binding domain-containing protein [Pedobacter steynii]|uniref:Putative DNA-binding domain-containing protein n=1 Tax=Pedobacter steynii TaxID=430522 RepID=A0A1G9KBT3_9SPHI|nr:ATP-binding protein [Pedobacter steynii]NQX38505.1 ATP-binding protein [Pedobacter steynii]SDL47069.1 Putative DNA-binding domain-containing protein [Pedobacter steynii]
MSNTLYTQTYLESIISGKIEESQMLEFKASGALSTKDTAKKEISKDISAFANAGGGIIIYGLKENPSNRHLVGEIDPIDRKTISKEWLEAIIQSTIQPRLISYEIFPIIIDDDDDKVVYVVDIKQSVTAHQALDHRYYRRYNFNVQPMNDYEIRDVFNRTKHPSLAIEFEINTNGIDFQRTTSFLKVFARNTGSVLAQYINCYLQIPVCLLANPRELDQEIAERFGDNTIRDLIDVKTWGPGLAPTYTYGPSRYDPLLPRLRTKLDFSEIELATRPIDSSQSIKWTVYADNAEPISGVIAINTIQVNYNSDLIS